MLWLVGLYCWAAVTKAASQPTRLESKQTRRIPRERERERIRIEKRIRVESGQVPFSGECGGAQKDRVRFDLLV